MPLASPFWEPADGWFTPFAPDLSRLSAEARDLMAGLRALDPAEAIHLRGSVLESPAPFHRSDLDLIVVHRGDRRLALQRDVAALTRRDVDLKWIEEGALQEDFVYYALLAHRAVHVAGPRMELSPLRADREFAWRHWVRYFPAGLPGQLDCSCRWSVVFFKQLARCLGVLMFLREGVFTRDIDACLAYAPAIPGCDAQELLALRRALDQGVPENRPISHLRRSLIRAFDASP